MCGLRVSTKSETKSYHYVLRLSPVFSVSASFSSTSSRRFLKNVGSRASRPKNRRVRKLLKLRPILSIYLSVRPVLIRMKLLGMRPAWGGRYRRRWR
jgi:hypothetical protein